MKKRKIWVNTIHLTIQDNQEQSTEHLNLGHEDDIHGQPTIEVPLHTLKDLNLYMAFDMLSMGI